jgi:hypothetical protein
VLITRSQIKTLFQNVPFAFGFEQFSSRFTDMYLITCTIAFHSSRGIDRLKQPNIDIKIKVERAIITGIFGQGAS